MAPLAPLVRSQPFLRGNRRAMGDFCTSNIKHGVEPSTRTDSRQRAPSLPAALAVDAPAAGSHPESPISGTGSGRAASTTEAVNKEASRQPVLRLSSFSSLVTMASPSSDLETCCVSPTARRGSHRHGMGLSTGLPRSTDKAMHAIMQRTGTQEPAARSGP